MWSTLVHHQSHRVPCRVHSWNHQFWVRTRRSLDGYTQWALCEELVGLVVHTLKCMWDYGKNNRKKGGVFLTENWLSTVGTVVTDSWRSYSWTQVNSYWQSAKMRGPHLAWYIITFTYFRTCHNSDKSESVNQSCKFLFQNYVLDIYEKRYEENQLKGVNYVPD